ncbi:alpha-1,2-mannosidase [Bacilli bacterium]|nr:alpha-1,2-mannosidase [Bacilli bacterium]
MQTRVSMIDTRFGTANTSDFSHGNCLPVTALPFAMNHFAPQTNGGRGAWWFHPDDSTLEGFRVTHQPSPWVGDFSTFLIQPVSGNDESETIYQAKTTYQRHSAILRPDCLSLTSERYQLRTTLVPSIYGAKLKIAYQQANHGLLLYLPEQTAFEKIDNQTIFASLNNCQESYDAQFTMHLALAFTSPIRAIKQFDHDHIRLEFEDDEPEQIITLTTSFISKEQLLLNLAREKQQTFKETQAQASAAWLDKLERVQIEDDKTEQVGIFNHCLYRAFLFPTRFYELDDDKQPIHYQTVTQTVEKGVYYTNNGFWDTAKTVYPLFSLIAQDAYSEMLEGFLNHYREVGYLPKWLSPDERGMMPGTLIDSVIADACVKGIRPDLMPEFLAAMIKSATIESADVKYGRQGVTAYQTFGYVPDDYHESVNATLDYAYSDYCIAQVAEYLGETAIFEKYQMRAKNYQNCFDAQTGLMRGKNRAGQFSSYFSPFAWGGAYTEGSVYQNGFYVVHDVAGLADLYPNPSAFIAKLDEIHNTPPQFEVGSYGTQIHEMSEMVALDFGQVAMSNQPSFHIPYLYHFVGKPDKAQVVLKQLMLKAFHQSPQAFLGDEDNGSMASWFIFNSLGFYPFCPGSGEYTLGIPLFAKATLALSNGKQLMMRANQTAEQYQFVTEIKINGQLSSKLVLKHEEIMQGQELDVKLGLVPTIKTYQSDDLPTSLFK